MRTGDKVQDFELPDQEGDLVRLYDVLSSGPVVLYFYIKAKTTG